MAWSSPPHRQTARSRCPERHPGRPPTRPLSSPRTKRSRCSRLLDGLLCGVGLKRVTILNHCKGAAKSDQGAEADTDWVPAALQFGALLLLCVPRRFRSARPSKCLFDLLAQLKHFINIQHEVILFEQPADRLPRGSSSSCPPPRQRRSSSRHSAAWPDRSLRSSAMPAGGTAFRSMATCSDWTASICRTAAIQCRPPQLPRPAAAWSTAASRCWSVAVCDGLEQMRLASACAGRLATNGLGTIPPSRRDADLAPLTGQQMHHALPDGTGGGQHRGPSNQAIRDDEPRPTRRSRRRVGSIGIQQHRHA